MDLEFVLGELRVYFEGSECCSLEHKKKPSYSLAPCRWDV